MEFVETGKFKLTLLDYDNQVVVFNTYEEACTFASRLVQNNSGARAEDITLYGPGDGTTSIMIRPEIVVAGEKETDNAIHDDSAVGPG